MLIDVHCHIDDKVFDDDRDEVVKRASNILIINAGVDPSSNRKTLEIAEKYTNVRACLGLHPEFIATFSEDLIEKEIAWIKKKSARIVAVSEIGLDYFWVKDEKLRERQKKIFRRMLTVADELNLPVIIHSRDAVNDTLMILGEYRGLRVILHGFSELDNRGYLVSIAPNVYRNKSKQRQVKGLPLAAILTETDSPLLGIDPKERNEPANVFKVVEKISELKAIEREKVESEIAENARKFFGETVL